jgi:hypothetical protein
MALVGLHSPPIEIGGFKMIDVFNSSGRIKINMSLQRIQNLNAESLQKAFKPPQICKP